MALKQISVFVPNETGSLEKLVNILAEAGVDMRAMSIADTQEFGIMRMIVKGNTKATTALREAGYLVNISYVTAVEIPDEPGGLARVVSILASHGVNIEYTYAFMTRSHGKACVVFRVEDNEAAERILGQNGIVTLSHLVVRALQLLLLIHVDGKLGTVHLLGQFLDFFSSGRNFLFFTAFYPYFPYFAQIAKANAVILHNTDLSSHRRAPPFFSHAPHIRARI